MERAGCFETISVTVVEVVPDTVSIISLDTVKSEGNGGTTPFTFTVSRSGDTSAASSVDYSIDGDVDATDFSGPLTGKIDFAAGQESFSLTLDVIGDSVIEADEAFTVTLSNPSGPWTIGTATASGTIQND
ncbi:MAG: Calx-beta domain-containing protein [Pirellulaceae bacterium]